MNIKMLKAACAGIIFSVAGLANAGVITFDGTTDREVLTGSSYNEDGFDLTFSGNLYFVDNSHSSFTALTQFDGDVLEFNNNGTYFDMVKTDGSLFTLNSVLTGTLGRDAGDDGAFTFIGTFDDNSTISTNLIATATKTEELFSGFDNLQSLRVIATDGEYPVLDNIITDATDIPEPSTIAIFALGLLGLASRKIKAQ